MNTDKVIDVEDLQEFLADEVSSFTYTAAAAAAAADVEDSIQNVASSRTQDRAEGDDAPAHEEVLSVVSFRGVGYNEKPFDCGGGDKEERSFDEVEGIIRQIHSDDTTTLTQSTSARDFAERKLPEDTFSFLIYTDVTCPCFVLGILVFLFQLSIYAVLFGDMADFENMKNPYDFPFNVSSSVRIAEVMAIFISIITQQDMRKAICLYRDGFDKCGLNQVFLGATLWKWRLSIVFRASEGLLGLIITFLLVMQSNSVRDLLLNFSAIEFVTMLDDVVFALASEGFLGRLLKKETKRLSKKSYYVSHEHANSSSAMKVSIAYFVVLCVSFYTGLGIISMKQKSEHYRCQLIFSQFDDEILPMLGTFTGLFSIHSKKFFYRASYRGVDFKDWERGPLLAYCDKEKRWTLSLTKYGASKEEWNPCDNWLVASSESTSFDLISTTSSPWIVNTPTNRGAPYANPFMACYECKYEDNFCGDNGMCLPGGLASVEQYDRCQCRERHYGLRCEYFETCPVLEVSPRDGNFPKGVSGYFASKYYRLNGTEA